MNSTDRPTPMPIINTSERLFDLVRYARATLHKNELISDEEYGWLCALSPMATSPKGGSPSRKRLEEYDEMRARIATLERTNAELVEALETLLLGTVEQWPPHDLRMTEAQSKARAILVKAKTS